MRLHRLSARRAAGALMRRLPSHLSAEDRSRLFQELAKTFGVDAVVRVGSNGAIEGSLHDEGLFSHYLREGKWASDSMEILKDFFASNGPGTFIDVGASIGLTLVPMTKVSGLSCIGIEASPVQFGLLQRNLLRNGANASVELHNVAAYETTGTLSLEVSETNHGDNRIRRQGGDVAPGRYNEQFRKTVDVPAVRLDDLIALASMRRPLAIKMDIQGSEPAVFRGAPRLIEATDILLMEFWPYGMRRLGHDPEEFLRTIQASFGSGAIVGEAGGGAPDRLEIGSFISTLRSRSAVTETGHLDVVLHKKPLKQTNTFQRTDSPRSVTAA